MKLSKLNNSSQKQAEEVTKKKVLESKDAAETEEHDGPIPGVSMDDPEYEVMRKRLSRIKKRNPDLYKKMINWE